MMRSMLLPQPSVVGKKIVNCIDLAEGIVYSHKHNIHIFYDEARPLEEYTRQLLPIDEQS